MLDNIKTSAKCSSCRIPKHHPHWLYGFAWEDPVQAIRFVFLFVTVKWWYLIKLGNEKRGFHVITMHITVAIAPPMDDKI